jgi:fructose-bisphosphate aldolase, class I
MLAARLNRLFAANGKCVAIAIDHGFFNEGDFLEGIEDIRAAVKKIAEGNPDGMLLSPGQAPLLQGLALKPKPALILRVDVANVYARELPSTTFVELMDNAVESAVRLDAACVIVNLFSMTGRPEVHAACVRNAMRIKVACERAAMPLMVEPLAMVPNPTTGAYTVNSDLKAMVPLVRQAVELGGDIIKADPTENYTKVIEAAGGRPVLVRGGGRVSETEIFDRTASLLDQGAAGIVYGRNVIQHPRAGQMVRALVAMVHGSATAKQAQEMVRA